MAHPFASYWDRGVPSVPDMTGAKHLLHGRDLEAVCAGLGLTIPLGNVLDIGCGTGRLARLCGTYTGADISPSMVEYCLQRHLNAHLISTYDELPAGPFDLVTCISVCTHIDRPERQDLIAAIKARTDRVLIDIIPGDGSGAVNVWTAVSDVFYADLTAAGFTDINFLDYQWDEYTHRYFYARA